MDIRKANRRDHKRNKNVYGHQEDGRSNKLAENLKRERADEIRKARLEKEKLIEGA